MTTLLLELEADIHRANELGQAPMVGPGRGVGVGVGVRVCVCVCVCVWSGLCV